MKQTQAKLSQIYTPLEIEQIKKVYDMDTIHQCDPIDQEEKDLTEHQLDTTCNLDIKNVTTKSVVLAPYNSSKSEIMNDSLVKYISVYSAKERILKIKNGKLKEID